MKATTYGILALALTVVACGPVVSETRTPAVLQTGFYAGERYEIRQRTIEGAKGPYEQTSVVYRGRARPCIIDSPNDCESAARTLITQFNETFF